MKKPKRFIEFYHWFFVDIVASADPKIPVENQIEKIESLKKMIYKTLVYKKNFKSMMILPTGDGAAIGFSKNVENPLSLAIQLHKLLYNYNKKRRGKNRLEIRIGIESGFIGTVKDFLGRDAFWGPGIILAKRVMDIGNKKHILTSENYAQIRDQNSEYREIIHYCGQYPIKHGKRIHIYNIYGKGFGNKKCPPIIEAISPPDTFVFEECNVELEVINKKTNLVHHSWKWNLKNPSNEPMDELSIIIDTDQKVKFSDLNFKITDKIEKKHVANLFEYTPFQKIIKIKLKKPVQPGRSRIFRIEFDSKEIFAQCIYTLATDCKKFVFKLTIPKNMEQEKIKLFQVDNLGNRRLVVPSPDIRQKHTKIEIIWSKDNVKMNDKYEYRW